jgi:hypothetical protein
MQVGNALDEWDRTHKSSTAYLIPVSDIHRVYDTLQGYVWYRGVKRDYRCEYSWANFYCPSHLAKFKQGKLQSYMEPRLKAMNENLEELARYWEKKSKTNHYVYLDHTHEVTYKPEYFAIDCFHLSETGQQSMANRISALLASP